MENADSRLLFGRLAANGISAVATEGSLRERKVGFAHQRHQA